MMGRHLRGAPLKMQEETSAVFFVSMSNRNLCLTRLIDVEVDEDEEASTVCNQEEGGSSSSYFNPVLPGCGNRRMLCFFIRIWLRVPAMYRDYHS